MKGPQQRAGEQGLRSRAEKGKIAQSAIVALVQMRHQGDRRGAEAEQRPPTDEWCGRWRDKRHGFVAGGKCL